MTKPILLIDDDELVLQSVASLLESQGYRVEKARNGFEAIDKVQGLEFGLVISDIRMPGMDGIELIKILREINGERKRKPVPEILITGYADENAYLRALRLKVTDYLYKPFDMKEFLGIVAKRLVFALLFSFLTLTAAYAEDEDLPPMPKGPLILTSDTPEMFTADYWINRLPNPDRVLKTPEELQLLNDDIHREITQEVDLFKMEKRRPGKAVRDQLELEYTTVKGRILFGVDNQRIPQSLFEQDIRPLVQWEKIPDSIQMRWGVATRPTSVRALPSDVKMLEEVGDIEFDQLQFTLIKLWTSVGIFHESSDGKWYYIQAPYVRGWVKAQDIALFSSREELEKFVKPASPLVVTGESISIFDGPELQQVSQRPSMGTFLPLAEKLDRAYVVWMPFRQADGSVSIQKAYVDSKSDVSLGFLPFTQRHIIRQAFKLLGARYGWGGMYNGRDCSGFTHDIFLTLGVDMPRGSKEQGFVGTQIDRFAYKEETEVKLAALKAATPGLTLMRLPKHQMLYLGEVNGKFYAIHSTWAERVSMTSDEKNRINQVVVSDLSLNGNSYLGSLFDRIISMNDID